MAPGNRFREYENRAPNKKLRYTKDGRGVLIREGSLEDFPKIN